MGQGLKINKAKIQNQENIVTLDEFNSLFYKDESIRTQLECPSCGTKLKYTKDYKKNNGTVVNAFFSLSPKYRHEKNCKYNLGNAIRRTIEKIKKIEYSNDIITDNNEEIIFKVRPLRSIFNSSRQTNNNNQVSTSNEVIQRKKEDYLKTTKDLARLWNSIQDKEDKDVFKEKIKIILDNNRIQWEDFVYDKDNLEKLWKAQVNYPVAFIVYIQRKEKEKKLDSLKNVYKCSSFFRDYKKSEKKIRRIIVPRIKYNKDLEIEKSYLIIAEFYFKDINRDEERGLEYINLYIDINSPSQIACLSR